MTCKPGHSPDLSEGKFAFIQQLCLWFSAALSLCVFHTIVCINAVCSCMSAGIVQVIVSMCLLIEKESKVDFASTSHVFGS